MSMPLKLKVGRASRASSERASAAVRHNPIILTTLLLLWIAGVILLTGCASIRQYSIESYQGTMPMHDLRYAGIDP
jgi:hypothetical protein